MNKAKGTFGESIALSYLIARGHTLINRNWTCRWGEIDLITLKGETLIFSEVKYRTSSLFGFPDQAITNNKLKAQKRAISVYLSQKDLASRYNFWVISIQRYEKKFKLKVYKDLLL